MVKKLFAMVGIGATLLFGGGQAFAATYQIQADDTLWKLSNAFHVSVADIQNANPGLNPLNLQTGQTIQIPGIQTYTATDSDTFWTIAQSQHVSMQALQALNPNVNANNMYQGLVLYIPTTMSGSVSAGSTGNTLVSAVSTGPVQPASSGANETVVAANGQSLQYTKEIDSTATAYTASAASNGSWGAVDYFGNPLQLGTIAVDPNEIPLGSKVYVSGYSFNGLPVGGMVCKATDIGGGIKGNHIDIFIPTTDTDASTFGIQNVKVYILK